MGLELESSIDLKSGCVSLTVVRSSDQHVLTCFSPDDGFVVRLSEGRYVVRCVVNDLSLSPSKYSVDVAVNLNGYTRAHDVIVRLLLFRVSLPAVGSGDVDWPHRPSGAIY